MDLKRLLLTAIVFLFLAGFFMGDSQQFNSVNQFNNDLMNTTKNIAEPQDVYINLGLINGTLPFGKEINRDISILNTPVQLAFGTFIYLSAIMSLLTGLPLELAALFTCTLVIVALFAFANYIARFIP